MLRLQIACVGRPDAEMFGPAVATYLKRLQGLTPATLAVVRPGRGRDAAARRTAEGAALKALAVGRTVALDERGARFSTVGLAAHLGELANRGEGRLTLMIGGPDGLDADLSAAADERWRLSDFTLPHELALVVLLEQLYRVASLEAGHPYHRS
jgi:23S rRNA (pseudouridine1915-N3)-methyltransferase